MHEKVTMMKKIQQLFIMFLGLILLSCNGSILEDLPESTGLSVEERGIWIAGGISSGAITSTVSQLDLFDPEEGAWYPAKTTLPTPVSFAGVAGLNGKIYVMGGFDSTGTVVNTVQIYDVATDTWSNGAGITGARANIYAAVIDERIYILGGTTANANVAWAGSTTTYEYTPATDSWASKVAYAGATNHSNRLTFAYDDVVYNLGGKSATSTLVATHDGVVVTANLLTTGVTEVALSAIRVGMAGALYVPDNGPATMVIIGGFSALTNTGCYAFNSASAGTALTTVQMLRYPFAATSAWLTATVLPANVGFGAAAIHETTLYYFGGTGYPASPTSIAYSYNLSSGIAGSWTLLESMPISRIGHAAVKVY